RFITHMKKLRDIETPLANFFASGVLALNEKLGPMLWQFPESFPYDPPRFEAFFALLPRDTRAAAELARRHDHRVNGRSWLTIDRQRPIRHAVEIRHESFLAPAFLRLLRRQRIALVFADSVDWPYAEHLTADFAYVRLHGATERYASGYGPAALDRWAARTRGWARGRDVYVYFDNDAKVRAPPDAQALAKRLADLRPSR
ncbi:MAG: DUF72 domain-containing protein, partial [Alphaproteobacteria bacterium]|nr:DUF72 domain-containing protein [Alphaproteobacteria bacterium]